MSASRQPKLIIHGGAGSALQDRTSVAALRQTLHSITEAIYSKLCAGLTASEAVIIGCQLLEDEPRFNAGTGSVLQSDGQIRMSAGLMAGNVQRFSGIINVSRVQHPITLAAALQRSSDRVVSEAGGLELVREQQVPLYNPLTELRLNEWLQERQVDFSRTMANVVAEPTPSPHAGRGTIGVVALDCEGQLAAGTSTGGKGFERVGRVSDSAMPAGNYATAQAAVSCTGIGEDIIDECLAARIVVRATDGLTLTAAFERSFQEAAQRQRDLGAIGIDATGAIAWGKTSDVLIAAYHNGENFGDTLELNSGVVVQGC